MTPLGKYIWLIKLLQGTNGMTFEEINGQWLKDRRNTEDENIPILKRTFHNHIKAIREEYGIYIECGPGYKYYIADADRDVLPKINLLSTLNMWSETMTDKILSKNVVIDDSFELYRDKKVQTIMETIKTRHKVELVNFRNVKQPDKYQVLNVAPYQLHHICSQWYVVGKTDEFGLMRIPLKYYVGVHKQDTTYKLPSQYSDTEYKKRLYGPSNENMNLVIQITSIFPENLLLDKFPLLTFQQNVEYFYTEKKEDKKTIVHNYAKVNLELPKSPFALNTLKNKLEKYRHNYKILNMANPFTLFTEEQYEEAMNKPIIL